MVAQARSADTRDLGFSTSAFAPRDALVYAQARKCIRGQLRIARRYLPYQFEKQR